MAFDYDTLRAEVAEPLIKEFGRTADIVRQTETGPSYDPTITYVDHEVIFMPTSYSFTNRNETLVQAGDVLGLISTETGVVVDKNTDRLKIDGVTYDIIEAKPLNYNGATTMLYKIHARK